MAIPRSEVESVKNQIIENRIPGNFSCSDIYEKIKLKISPDRDNPKFYIDRLTRVCYILCAQNFLGFHKEANKAIFKKVYDPLNFTKIKAQSKASLTRSNSGMTKCPHCKAPVSAENLKDHVRKKCPIAKKKEKIRKSVKIK